MEKRITTQVTYKTVPNGTKDVISYVASDGKEFFGASAEKNCVQYEQQLEHERYWSLVETVDSPFEVYEIPTNWYHAKDEMQLELIKRHVGFYNTYDTVYLNDYGKNMTILKVGDWISGYFEDGGDYRGKVCIYTLEYIKSEVQKYLDSLPKP